MGKIIYLFRGIGDDKMNELKKSKSALDVAKYVIYKSKEIGYPVSNLQLQKILYYIQGAFLSKLGYEAFSDSIMAWDYGPVVPSVYYEFNIYVSGKIRRVYASNEIPEFDEEEHKVIDSVIENKSKMSAWDLVDATHNQDPWLNSFRQGLNMVIQKDEIKRYFSLNNID